MPPPEDFNAFIKELQDEGTFRQANVWWNRLEGRPRVEEGEEFESNLRTEVRDALWTLCRQWQFGEFRGEDAGSPINAKVKVTGQKLDLYQGAHSQPRSYDEEVPLEAQVEAETLPATLGLRVRMGYVWRRMLQRQKVDQRIIKTYARKYPIEIPMQMTPSNDHIFAHQEVWQTYAAYRGRAIDGYELYQHLKGGGDPLDGIVIPAELKAAQQQTISTALTKVRNDFLEWFDRAYVQPPTKDRGAWNTRHLEYGFECSLKGEEDQSKVLSAKEYHGGSLDWYSMDVASSNRMLTRPVDAPPVQLDKPKAKSFIPMPVEFSGMPKTRWWEFEDRRLNIGEINVERRDLARLLLMEFGLVYANDWFLLPLELSVGQVYTITELEVTDAFGIRTKIKAAGLGANQDWQEWRMFNLSSPGKRGTADTALWLPPTVGALQESKPLESVNFVRDEMANMVWGIETRIPLETGVSKDGYESATEIRNFHERLIHNAKGSPEVTNETETAIHYQLQSYLQENWIPFIPVRIADEGDSHQIQLQRGAIYRVIDGVESDDDRLRIYPRTKLLSGGIQSKTDPSKNEAFFIHEEEIPQAGAIVSQTFQRVRWYNGKVVTWLGRRKRTGRGPGRSNLLFDQIIPNPNEP